MNKIAAIFLVWGLFSTPSSAQNQEGRIADLERKLSEAKGVVATLQKSKELSGEVQALRQGQLALRAASALPHPSVEKSSDGFKEQIIQPDQGGDEHESALSGRLELFNQSRFQTLPISGANQQNAPSKFVLTRMESRWSGRISIKIGMGFEIQYHPAPFGAAVELVNDAFVEY